MLQYLLNATAIWLISLVMFDVFLRRESYHRYNRFYLLFTFLSGVLFPLLQWQKWKQVYSAALDTPLKRVVAVKQTIITVTPSTGTINIQFWLSVLYLSGAFVALCLLVFEIIKLSAAYRPAKTSKHESWTVIETGKPHAPFSFLNTLFVCSIAQYNTAEWQMILRHEQEHTRLFHFADLLLMQLARIVFWFHPLVYIYNKRLLLVHEYQADNASAQQPQVYGRFLVEQAILQSAPALSHSFNRSPIKNRILMLTRKSGTAAKTKMLVFIPLVMVCVLCFSKNIFSQEKAWKNSPFVRLGSISDTGWHQKLSSYDPILSNPQLVCDKKDAEIIRFTFSIQPKGKDYLGPYTCTGSKLNEKMLETLKKVKESDTGKTMIFIEDIHVKYKGEDMVGRPLIYWVQPA